MHIYAFFRLVSIPFFAIMYGEGVADYKASCIINVLALAVHLLADYMHRSNFVRCQSPRARSFQDVGPSMTTLVPARFVDSNSSDSQLTCTYTVEPCAPQPSLDCPSIESVALTPRHKAEKAGSWDVFYRLLSDVVSDPDEEDSDCLSSLHSSDADDKSWAGEVEPVVCAALLACRLSQDAAHRFALGFEPSLGRYLQVSAFSTHNMLAPAVHMTGPSMCSLHDRSAPVVHMTGPSMCSLHDRSAPAVRMTGQHLQSTPPVQNLLIPTDSKPFQLIPTDSKSFQLIPTDSKSSQLIPTDSKSFQLIPTDSKSFQQVPTDPKSFQLHPTCNHSPATTQALQPANQPATFGGSPLAPFEQYVYLCSQAQAPFEQYVYLCSQAQAPFEQYVYLCSQAQAPFEQYVYLCSQAQPPL
eukprot:gene12164-15276_t